MAAAVPSKRNQSSGASLFSFGSIAAKLKKKFPAKEVNLNLEAHQSDGKFEPPSTRQVCQQDHSDGKVERVIQMCPANQEKKEQIPGTSLSRNHFRSEAAIKSDKYLIPDKTHGEKTDKLKERKEKSIEKKAIRNQEVNVNDQKMFKSHPDSNQQNDKNSHAKQIQLPGKRKTFPESDPSKVILHKESPLTRFLNDHSSNENQKCPTKKDLEVHHDMMKKSGVADKETQPRPHRSSAHNRRSDPVSVYNAFRETDSRHHVENSCNKVNEVKRSYATSDNKSVDTVQSEKQCNSLGNNVTAKKANPVKASDVERRKSETKRVIRVISLKNEDNLIKARRNILRETKKTAYDLPQIKIVHVDDVKKKVDEAMPTETHKEQSGKRDDKMVQIRLMPRQTPKSNDPSRRRTTCTDEDKHGATKTSSIHSDCSPESQSIPLRENSCSRALESGNSDILLGASTLNDITDSHRKNDIDRVTTEEDNLGLNSSEKLAHGLDKSEGIAKTTKKSNKKDSVRSDCMEISRETSENHFCGKMKLQEQRDDSPAAVNEISIDESRASRKKNLSDRVEQDSSVSKSSGNMKLRENVGKRADKKPAKGSSESHKIVESFNRGDVGKMDCLILTSHTPTFQSCDEMHALPQNLKPNLERSTKKDIRGEKNNSFVNDRMETVFRPQVNGSIWTVESGFVLPSTLTEDNSKHDSIKCLPKANEVCSSEISHPGVRELFDVPKTEYLMKTVNQNNHESDKTAFEDIKSDVEASQGSHNDITENKQDNQVTYSDIGNHIETDQMDDVVVSCLNESSLRQLSMADSNQDVSQMTLDTRLKDSRKPKTQKSSSTSEYEETPEEKRKPLKKRKRAFTNTASDSTLSEALGNMPKTFCDQAENLKQNNLVAEQEDHTLIKSLTILKLLGKSPEAPNEACEDSSKSSCFAFDWESCSPLEVHRSISINSSVVTDDIIILEQLKQEVWDMLIQDSYRRQLSDSQIKGKNSLSENHTVDSGNESASDIIDNKDGALSPVTPIQTVKFEMASPSEITSNNINIDESLEQERETGRRTLEGPNPNGSILFEDGCEVINQFKDFNPVSTKRLLDELYPDESDDLKKALRALVILAASDEYRKLKEMQQVAEYQVFRSRQRMDWKNI